jgi:hypothetical protein
MSKYSYIVSDKRGGVMSIEEHIFTGVTTHDWMIDKSKCIAKLMEYLKTRRYDCILSNNVLYVVSENEDHIVNLLWNEYGFDLEEEYDDLNPLAYEVISVATSIIFRSLFQNAQPVEIVDDDWDDEDLWV